MQISSGCGIITRMQKTFHGIRSCWLAAGLLAAFSACSMDITLMPNGEIRFGKDGDRVFRTLASLPGWQGLSTKSGWAIKTPGIAPFSLARGTNAFLKAVANLKQLPGGRRLGAVPSEMRDGRLTFTASVDGPNGARMLYEIVRKN